MRFLGLFFKNRVVCFLAEFWKFLTPFGSGTLLAICQHLSMLVSEEQASFRVGGFLGPPPCPPGVGLGGLQCCFAHPL